MPTYDYECTKCGIEFEMFQPITEPARKKLKKSDPKPCNCNARVERRIGTGAGIIFKGSGFYQTDYRSESYKKAAKADKESSGDKTKSDTKSDGKSDSSSKTDSGASSTKKESTGKNGDKSS